MSDDTEQRLASLQDEAAHDTSELPCIGKAKDETEQVLVDLQDAVMKAFTAGYSWTEIAEILRTSRQATPQRSAT